MTVTGSEGTLSTDCFVCATKADLERVKELSVANDAEGLQQMVLQGRVLVAAPGTRIRVLDTSLFAREVRILSGPQSGGSGWVDSEFVK